MSRSDRYALAGRIFVCLLICFSFFVEASRANTAIPKITISQAKWAKGVLTVKGSVRHSAAAGVDLYDGSGRLLGQATIDGRHRFALRRTDLDQPELLCSVQAKTTDATATVAVKGKPKSCAKVPQCKILAPVGSFAVMVNSDVSFKAKATLKDRKAEPLKMEWDFAGGSMGEAVPNTTPQIYHRPTGTDTTVQFVRDNGRYRVRFMAWDRQNRYCEDSVEVVVGTPPDADVDFAEKALPNVQALAQTAQQSAPAKGAPLQGQTGDWVVLPFQDWTMQNATDARTQPNTYLPLGPPVQNINAVVYAKGRQPMVVDGNQAALDYAAASNPADPAGPDSINTTSQNWPLDKPLQQATVQKSDWFETLVRPANQAWLLDPAYVSFSYAGFLDPSLSTLADEGYHDAKVNPDHGRYMPGIGKPYQANDAQPFSGFDTAGNHFAASMLPVTDIDDSGRVNPSPLFRIAARGGNGRLATTDLALSASRDMHCRGCHAKGQIAAVKDTVAWDLNDWRYAEPASDSLFDQEYAALHNTTLFHPKPWSLTYRMVNADPGFIAETPVITSDGPAGCASGAAQGCHGSPMQTAPFGRPLLGAGYAGQLSTAVHLRHGYLESNDRTTGGSTGSPSNSLFPVKDDNGDPRRMEENCLRCHGGLREQSYRDRMYSAGVTCYQCHGDMLAVAGIPRLALPNPDGTTRRRSWIDEPDCGSCHTGNANRDPAHSDRFYSPGVMKTAFDETDPSASPRQPDPANPDEVRFAVPISAQELGNIQHNADGSSQPFVTKSRLYRLGKDNHGQVPCAACHGAAHGIWPMRDPKANDNLTALQLQGHTGPIAECPVCHTADAFAQFADLDEGIRASNAKEGILGGPHNMHPVDDPNWWQGAAADDTPNQGSGEIKGGWHNDYAKIPGRTGEDQCAACHGNDHRGTRLSKTPVDRDFVTAKGKRIHVAAGTPIGCNLCHTIARSCTGSPAGADCGKTSDTVAAPPNLKPVFSSSAESEVTIGEDYRHTVAATDPEGQALSFQLQGFADLSASFDAQGGVISLPAASVMDQLMQRMHSATGHTANGAFAFDYYVRVRDDQGAEAVQLVRATAVCPAGSVIDMASHHGCSDIVLIRGSAASGVNAGNTYRNQMTVHAAGSETPTYGLQGQPEGMAIDASGLIQWTPTNSQAGETLFTVTASNDKGSSAQQTIHLTVCAPPLHWNEATTQCAGPVAFVSQYPVGAVDNGGSYRYRVIAAQSDRLPLTLSLIGAPDGMTLTPIDERSAWIDWSPRTTAPNLYNYTIRAADGLGESADLPAWIWVCFAPEIAYGNACQIPVQLTSQLDVNGLVAGEHFEFQAVATHLRDRPIAYSLGSDAPAGMSIDANSGLIDWTAAHNPDGYVSFTVIATDDSSPPASASQQYGLTVCAEGMRWDQDYALCQGPIVIDPQPLLGADAGSTFTYPVKASLPGGGSFTLSLADQPAGMTMDANGLITWQAAVDPVNGNSFGFTVIATDAQGRQTLQYGGVTVCEAPSHWKNDSQACQ